MNEIKNNGRRRSSRLSLSRQRRRKNEREHKDAQKGHENDNESVKTVKIQDCDRTNDVAIINDKLLPKVLDSTVRNNAVYTHNESGNKKHVSYRHSTVTKSESSETGGSSTSCGIISTLPNLRLNYFPDSCISSSHCQQSLGKKNVKGLIWDNSVDRDTPISPIAKDVERIIGDDENKSHLKIKSEACISRSIKSEEYVKGYAKDTATIDSPRLHTHGRMHSYKTGAYVQHLAEICHSILHDLRWRTEKNFPHFGSSVCTNKIIDQDSSRNSKNAFNVTTGECKLFRLFCWEDGDDLSAVWAFERLFSNPHDCEVGNNALNSPEQKVPVKEVTSIPSPPIEIDELEQEARRMHLYARMFHRKGPWFTLPDLFFRYYYGETLINEPTDTEEKEKISYATPKKHMPCFMSSKLENSLKDFFIDIEQLNSSGLIRTFLSEEECGIIVGNVGKGNSIGNFTKKDQMAVLDKLGGINKCSPNLTRTNNVNGKRKRTRLKKTGNGNAIWKQMCSQRSIDFSPHKKSSRSNTKILLPVRHHVTNVMLENFASKIVSTLEGSERKSISHKNNQNKSSIQNYVRIIKHVWKENSHKSISMCFRNREEPLQTLRRAARLSIVAGGGSGNMRWNGANGWLPVQEYRDVPEKDEEFVDFDILEAINEICTLPTPISSSLWHQVSFPGLNFRFNLLSCAFIKNYDALLVSNNSDLFDQIDPEDVKMVCIFPEQDNFKLWEMFCDIRSRYDYLSEFNDMLLYAIRKIKSKKRGKKTINGDFLNTNCATESMPDPEKSKNLLCQSIQDRKVLIGRLIKYFPYSISEEYSLASIFDNVEKTIDSLKMCDSERVQVDQKQDQFHNNAERQLCFLSIICRQVLFYRLQTISTEEMNVLIDRPWLRHLSWESVCAYLIWDCVSILEKRGYHEIAYSFLITILIGPTNDESLVSSSTFLNTDNSFSFPSCNFVKYLLSRRVRGKAFKRLVIDSSHIMRNREKKSNAAIKNVETRKKKKKDAAFNFSSKIISFVGKDGSIPFSFVRYIARKSTLSNIFNIEMNELGIRLENKGKDNTNDLKIKKTGYTDWTPITDFSVANPISHESDSVGKRCAFIGLEEKNRNGMDFSSSLNVEELAIQEYASGRLPEDNMESNLNHVKGGWSGWHDEGLHVRTLFRLCCEPLLGLRFKKGKEACEQFSIFLTPYQSAPLDLHVGHFNLNTLSCLTRSFYERRRSVIECFLGKLEKMQRQELCDFVYQCVMNRYGDNQPEWNKKDSHFNRDLKGMRKLQLLASGFGGKMLVVIFRSLFFDYRHYCAGLPDLLLVRATSATQTNNNDVERKVIDLAKWVGDEFSNEHVSKDNAVNSSMIMIDKDDEFLGCSGHDQPKLSRGRRKPKKHTIGEDIIDEIPQKLQLTYMERQVDVECMFVEVKSANDTLDERQEDWLNILDRQGNARVCKFLATKKYDC